MIFITKLKNNNENENEDLDTDSQTDKKDGWTKICVHL